MPHSAAVRHGAGDWGQRFGYARDRDLDLMRIGCGDAVRCSGARHFGVQAMKASKRTTGSERRVPGWCALCRSRCGCISVVREGRLVAVEPNPDHPTGRALCAKGQAAPELVYSSDRILHPLRRTRPKGDPDPGWVRIGWDEALDLAAAKLKGIVETEGRKGVAFAITTPSGTSISDSHPWVERFVRAFGDSQQRLRHRDLQLAQGPRYPLHLRDRDRHPGPRARGVRAPLGPQPDRSVACAGAAGERGEGAGYAARGGRPAPGGGRREGGRVVARAPRHRWRARLGARGGDDRGRVVRP